MKHNIKLFSVLAIMFCMLFSVKVYAGYTFIEGGSSMAAAQNISLNKEYAAVLHGNETLYFKFTTPAQKGFFDFYAKNINIETHSWSGDAQVQFQLIDAVSEEMSLIQNGYGGELTNNLSLESSTTYYIKVKNNWVESNPDGNFKFSVTYTEDKVGDTKENATKISLDKKIAGTLDGNTDVDYYKFTTGKWRTYTLTAQNVNISTHSWSHDYQFYVRVKSAIDEIQSDVRMTYGSSGEGKMTLSPNTTYYIEVRNPETGRGQYTFKIAPDRIDITQAQTSYKTKFTYTGKNICPKVTVTYNGKKLTKDKDYTLTYSANKAPGIAKITLKGIDNYTGKAVLKFNIAPKKQTVSVSNSKKGKLTVKLKKDSGATGYQIGYGTSAKYKGEKKTKVTSVKTTVKVTKGRTYYVRARSYKKVGKTYIYGDWSKAVKIKIKK